jgi:hypothetical protein
VKQLPGIDPITGKRAATEMVDEQVVCDRQLKPGQPRPLGEIIVIEERFAVVGTVVPGSKQYATFPASETSFIPISPFPFHPWYQCNPWFCQTPTVWQGEF